MPQTTIHQLQGEEFLEALYFLSSYSFHPSPPLRDEEKWRERVSARQGVKSYGLFEESEPVAIVAETQMNQHVRGQQMDMAGVWGVATHPKARRRGYCKRLMKRLLASIYEDDRPLSTLYPFRESFYERLGYVTFPQPKEVSLDPATLSPLLKMDLDGEVEMLSIKEGYSTYSQFVARV